MNTKLQSRPNSQIPRGLTIDEFLAFTATRPDGERWELIEGEPVLSPSPTDWHQAIVLNIGMSLGASKTAHKAKWTPIAGMSTRVHIAPNTYPQPDVMVLQRGLGQASKAVTDDALVVFEVLSPSNRRKSQAWRQQAFATIPNCEHYVTVSQKLVEVTRYDRATNWKGQTLRDLSATLALPALGPVEIAIADIYQWTPLGPT